MSMTIEELVSKYVVLRDKKAQLKAEFDAKTAKITEVMDRIEGKMLEFMTETGTDALKTSAGTAYVTTSTKATVASWEDFFTFVQNQEAWQLLEHRCSKKAVEEFVAANDELPPGVNWSAARVVNFRRS